MNIVTTFTDGLDTVFTLLQGSLSLVGVAWITVTVAAYCLAMLIMNVFKGHPLLNPVLVTVLLIATVLWLGDISVQNYQYHTGLIQWLLGPATVALAIPMYAQWEKIRELGWRLIVSVMAGGVIAPVLGWGCLYVMNAPLVLQMSMLTKSITTPLAMNVSEQLGGVPALAAAFVIASGIVGAIVAPLTYRMLNIYIPQARGVALGTVCHAIGTARALQMGERTGALATLGLCVNGIISALVLPLLFSV